MPYPTPLPVPSKTKNGPSHILYTPPKEKFKKECQVISVAEYMLQTYVVKLEMWLSGRPYLHMVDLR